MRVRKNTFTIVSKRLKIFRNKFSKRSTSKFVLKSYSDTKDLNKWRDNLVFIDWKIEY